MKFNNTFYTEHLEKIISLDLADGLWQTISLTYQTGMKRILSEYITNIPVN